jgi:hypothetical protein
MLSQGDPDDGGAALRVRMKKDALTAENAENAERIYSKRSEYRREVRNAILPPPKSLEENMLDRNY